MLVRVIKMASIMTPTLNIQYYNISNGDDIERWWQTNAEQLNLELMSP